MLFEGGPCFLTASRPGVWTLPLFWPEFFPGVRRCKCNVIVRRVRRSTAVLTEPFGLEDVVGSARCYKTRANSCTILDFLTNPLPRVQDKMAALLVANTLLWPMARFLNDKFVPEEHRVTANHIMTVRQHLYMQSLFGTYY